MPTIADFSAEDRETEDDAVPEPPVTAPGRSGLVDLPSFDPPAAPAPRRFSEGASDGLGRVRDIPLEVTVELGRTRLLIRDIMDLVRQARSSSWTRSRGNPVICSRMGCWWRAAR